MARRQKGLPLAQVPAVCVLDPDGDMVRELVRSGRAVRDRAWACYHTDLQVFEEDGLRLGFVGGVVGASFAVLVAEELFASGCEVLLSVTSAGQVSPRGEPPYFVLIERALRDEGTSYHYLPPSRFCEADPDLLSRAAAALDRAGLAVERGSSWTTDAPFRETPSAIATHREEGILAVEMEAAALYAFGAARGRPVLCFAHITNQMAQAGADFEKGPQNGATEGLTLIEVVARAARGPVGSIDRVRHIIERLAFMGVTPADTGEVRTQKVTLTLAAMTVTVLAVGWVATYLALGLPGSAAIPFAYQVASVTTLAVLARTKDYRFFRVSQLDPHTAAPVPPAAEPRRLRRVECSQSVGARGRTGRPVLLQRPRGHPVVRRLHRPDRGGRAPRAGGLATPGGHPGPDPDDLLRAQHLGRGGDGLPPAPVLGPGP